MINDKNVFIIYPAICKFSKSIKSLFKYHLIPATHEENYYFSSVLICDSQRKSLSIFFYLTVFSKYDYTVSILKMFYMWIKIKKLRLIFPNCIVVWSDGIAALKNYYVNVTLLYDTIKYNNLGMLAILKSVFQIFHQFIGNMTNTDITLPPWLKNTKML